MIDLETNKPCMHSEMVQKLLHDPDKFERMFAARYLFKYNFTESKSILEEALLDKEPDVAICIARLFESRKNLD